MKLAGDDIRVLAKGAGQSLFGKIVGRVFQFAIQILLARLLGPGLFGLFAIGWTLMRIVGVIAPLGLQNGVIHFAARKRDDEPHNVDQILYQAIGVSVASGTLFAAVFLLAAPGIAQAYNQPELRLLLQLFALGFPLLTALRVTAAGTRISHQMKFTVIAEDIAQPLTNLGLIALFYALGWGLVGATVATTLSYGVALGIALTYLIRLYPISGRAAGATGIRIRSLLAFSLPTAFTGMFFLLISWVDRLLIGFFRPIAEVGVYQAVSESTGIFAIILSGFNAIFAPMIASLFHQKEYGRMQDLYTVSTKWGLYLSVPIFITLFLAPREIITVVFGQDYRSGYLPLIILAAGQLINVGTGGVAQILIMTGNQNVWFRLTAVAAIVNIALNLILVPPFGMVGSAIATATSVSGLFLAGVYQVRRTHQLWPYDRRFLKGLLAAGAATLAVVVFKFTGPTHDLLALVVTMALAMGVFAVILWWQGFDREDREIAAIILRRLAKKPA